ncbi:MAG: type II secretion system protein [Patescibacteria group bacterium]
MKKNLSRLKGFTLIELLVVVFIIAVLASLVIVNVSGARASARDAKRVANMKTIQGALEQYNEKYGTYPMTVSKTAVTGFIDCGGSVWGIGNAPVYCRPANPSPHYNSAVPSGTNLHFCQDGYCGACSDWGFYDSQDSSADGYSSWIPGLTKEFMQSLPNDPKFSLKGDQCIVYKSDGTDYKIRGYGIMETINTGGTGAGSGTKCEASASLRDILDWRCTDAHYHFWQNVVSLTSSGRAYYW